MSDLSIRLGLPYLQPSQAQKHVTHNEALQVLDILVQLVVEDFYANQPPGTPVEGQIWALGAAPIGDWAGKALHLACWLQGAWVFILPQTGWRATLGTELRLWDGSQWAPLSVDLANLEGVGINTAYDLVNRLSVSAPATLLSHEGAGHQLKINKAAATDTASLLFQTNWSGRAEMGTAGNDNFAIKVSPDGSTWINALSLSAATGIASGQAVQQSKTDVSTGRLMRADYGYGPGNLLGTVSQTGGVPGGAVIERGSNANGEYVRFADGTQICWHRLNGVAVTSAVGGLFRSDPIAWTFPASFALGTVNGAQVIGRLSNPNGLCFNAPYAARTTWITDGRAFATASVAATEIYLTALGFWY